MPFTPPSHTPFPWQDAPSTATPIDAANLTSAELDQVGFTRDTATAYDTYAENQFVHQDGTGLPDSVAQLNAGTGPTVMDGRETNTGAFFQSINSADPMLGGTLAPNANGIDLLADPAISTAGIYSADKSGGTVNIYHLSSYVYSTGTANATALFGQAVGLSVWGANPAAYSYGGSTASAIGTEIDFGNFSTTTTTVSGTQGPLPLATINVASTTGALATNGTLSIGNAIISYAAITPTSFTGCTVLNGSTITLTGGATITYSTGGRATGLSVVAHGAAAGGAPGSQFITFNSSSAGDQCNYGLLFAGSDTATGKQPIGLTGIYFNGLYTSQAISVGSGSYKQIISLVNTVADTAAIYLNAVTAPQGLAVIGGDYSGEVIQIAPTTATYAINVPLGTYTTFLRFAATATHGIDLSSATISAEAIHLGEGHNIALGTSTGTIIGTSTTQKMAFWGHTPIVQPSAAGSATGYAAGTTVATFHSDDTYTGNVGTTGYTVNGMVAALKNMGALAS